MGLLISRLESGVSGLPNTFRQNFKAVTKLQTTSITETPYVPTDQDLHHGAHCFEAAQEATKGSSRSVSQEAVHSSGMVS